jgi:hypothetical protein
MALPNLFLVGSAKSGTSSLHDALQQHPQIFMSDVKEPCYFSEGFPHWITSLAEYEALFAGAGTAPVIGESSSTYLDDPASPARIRAAIAHPCKILISLRNPAERAYSQWGHSFYHEGYETLPFEAALQAEEERYQDAESLKKHPYYRPGIFQYYGQGLYAERVRRYVEAFGRDSVHVVIFEEMMQDSARELAAVFQFLQVDAAHAVNLQNRNQARTARFRFLSDFLQAPPAILTRTYERLPHPIQQGIFRTARALYWSNQQARTNDKLEPALRQHLLERYRPATQQLEDLLGRDLSLWYH